jgi:hypothetical protein
MDDCRTLKADPQRLLEGTQTQTRRAADDPQILP